MIKKIAFMQLEVEVNAYPLVPAYLSGYARLNPEIKNYWEFITIINSYDISSSELVSHMHKADADVYAFSCYAWNMGLIKQVIYSYIDGRPDVQIILGGPQVTYQAEKYLKEEYENIIICNGEGERVFKNYLKELMDKNPNLTKVRGLSFYRNCFLETTLGEEQIKDLDEIPSPFSNELFNKGKYGGVNLEASRGCPFHCTYCYWGSMGIKPSKFSDRRVMSDIEWIAENNIPWINFNDTNFGFYSRDAELARFIVKCKKEHNAPDNILFSPYRKNWKRVFDICRILHDADITALCILPFQTIDETAMERINRKSSDSEKLIRLLHKLNKSGIKSISELIWPLPGETLESFKKGIADLCKNKNNIFLFHTLALLNNICLQGKKEEYGLVTKYTRDINSEGEIVVQTNEVTHKEYIEGMRFAAAVNIIFDMRGLYITAEYLNSSGLEKYENLFSKFADFIISHKDFIGFSVLKTMEEEKNFNPYLIFSTAYDICHKKRDLFDKQLFQFASSQSWWNNENARLCFETDLLNRGYCYSGQVKEKDFAFRHIQIRKTLPDGYIIEIPSFFKDSLKEMLGIKAAFSQPGDFVPGSEKTCLYVNHNQSQKMFDSNQSYDEIIQYCIRLFYFSNNYLPVWEEKK